MRTWRICVLAWGVLGALLGGKAQETSKDGRPLQTEEGIGERHRRSVQGDQQPLTRRDFERQWEVLQEIRNFTLGNMVKLVAMDALLQQMNGKLPVSQNLSHTAEISSSHLSPSSANSGSSGSATRTPTAAPVIEPIIEAVAASGNVERTGGSSRGRGSGGSRGGGSRPSSSGSNRRGSSVSTSEMQQLTEQLLTKDNALGVVSTSLQGRAPSAGNRDNARDPLIASVSDAALERETVKVMRKLLDNYLPQVADREDRTAAERQEEQNFLNALMKTQVIQTAETFLRQKNLISGNFRDTLNTIWFSQYRRKGRHMGSSGFEHVFVGEVKDGKVSGFHNWLNFLKEERKNVLNYKGYIKVVDLNGKGEIVKARFDWLNKPKQSGSVFIGTTPELEVALYTVCFLAKPNSRCPVQLAGHKFNIQTWDYNSNGNTVIGSAYPEI